MQFSNDQMRRWAGLWLGAMVRIPRESPHTCQTILPGCELLSYGGGGPSVLIIPAPIKRPYIWDLLPEASAVRRLLEQGFSVSMLRWGDAVVKNGAGLEFFAATAPAAALRRLPPGKVLIAGHSLGGLFAAMAACLFRERVAGLLLIETPLAFSAHRFGMAGLAAPVLAPLLRGSLSGSTLSLLSTTLLPDEFLWKRWRDCCLAAHAPHRLRLHLGVLRWAYDEFPLPEPLTMELLALMAEDRFLHGRLNLCGRRLGPRALHAPVLAVTVRSALTPPATMEPFLAQCPDARLVTFRSEVGTALDHVSPLIGPEAQKLLWPEIARWARQRG